MTAIIKKAGGKYRIENKLGQGGTSEVYQAYDEAVGRRVVLKAAIREKAHWKEDSVCRETDILAGLDCGGIPRVLDCFEEQGRKILVMDYIEGINLDEYIEKYGPMEEKRALYILAELAEILEYLHINEIIYLDLKPSNIMLVHGGGIKLIDFGSAVYKKETAGEFIRCGTYGYAAPELLEGKRVDEGTDIYSLGATGYYLLTGISPAKPPYKMQPITDWNKALSKSTEIIIQNCVQHNKDMRYTSLEQLREDLNNGRIKPRITVMGMIKEYIRRRRKIMLRQEKNIFRSEKKAAWMLRAIFPAIVVAGLYFTPKWDMQILYAAMPDRITADGAVSGQTAEEMSVQTAVLQKTAADSSLFVNVRNEIGQKLLIREGSIYYTKESIVFEIPVRELEPEIEYEVRILSKNIQSGHEKERKFQIVRQEDGNVQR